METVVAIIVLLGLVGGALWYVIRARKKGRRCIGCTEICCGDGGTCTGMCSTCRGCSAQTKEKK